MNSFVALQGRQAPGMGRQPMQEPTVRKLSLHKRTAGPSHLGHTSQGQRLTTGTVLELNTVGLLDRLE
jgi:hypothetical protein